MGEALCCIICKAICLVTCEDVEMVCGSSQLCAGVQCGIEGAIHASVDLFDLNN